MAIKKTGKAVKSGRKRTYFKLEKKAADEVRLAGTFNDWDPDSRLLKKNRSGVWSTWMMLAPGKYEYRYLVDGEWYNDPDVGHCPNEFGGENCILTVA